MTTTFNLRQAEIGDLDLMVKLRVDFLQECAHSTAKHDQNVLQQTRDYFLRKTKSGELQTWFAFDQTNIAAVGSWLINEMPPTVGYYGGGFEGYLFNVYTLPKYRRKGLATLITKRIMQEAKDKNCSRIWLMYSNEVAEQVYSKLGFQLRSDVMELFL